MRESRSRCKVDKGQRMERTIENHRIITVTKSAYGQSKEMGMYALAAAWNELKIEEAKHICAEIEITIPTYAFKSRIHTMEKFMKQLCKEKEVELAGIRSEKSTVVNQTMVRVTLMGVTNAEKRTSADCKEQMLVMTKWSGVEGMLRIATEREANLKERFSAGFMKQILSYKEAIFAGKEIVLAQDSGVSLIRQITDGGVLAALWNLAKEMGTGLEADLRQLPVLQETIEVCEHFRLNPYQLTSAGALLMVTRDGDNLVEMLREHNIPACIVGKLTDSNDKILRNGEEIRYIDRPAPDELMKIFEEKE